LNFNSSEFLVFFPIATIVYYLIPFRFRYIWLLICSYYFYMCWNPVYVLLIIFSTVVTWISGMALESVKKAGWTKERTNRSKKLCVALSFVLNLAVLAYFKYAGFFIGNINSVLSHIHVSYKVPAVDILLPVGISFYTFQALSYTMDVYRDDISAEKNFLRYSLFVSFFPQLVAGPIERSKNLLKQLNEEHPFSYGQARSGLFLMMWGFFLKMVVADRIAIFVDNVYSFYTTYTGWYLIVATVLFAIQIYCDFGGYSAIAMGAAQVMGFRLTDNFNAPYLSYSTADFWRRWHISLTNWFRDYVYIPLGGSRRGTIRRYFNIMVVFFLSGLWHGAGWGYIIWGALNGLYQVIGDILKPVMNKAVRVFHVDRDSFSHRLLRMITTFILIDLSWVFFRTNSFSASIIIIRSMLTAGNIWVLFDDSIFNLGLDQKNFFVLFLSVLLLVFADLMKRKGVCLRKVIGEQGLWFRWLVIFVGVLCILIFGIWGSGYNAENFIYFQF